jgi:hypothetical protein
MYAELWGFNNRTAIGCLGLAILLMLPGHGFASSSQDKSYSEPTRAVSSAEPRPNKLSDIWVTVEGSVPFGDETTYGDAKIRSRENARRAAVQQAVGTFVQSKSVVYNFQLAEDLIRTSVRGLIVEENILQEGVQSIGSAGKSMGLMYVTKIKAKVRPVPMERKGTITVNIRLNKTLFVDGEEMAIHVTANQDVFLHVFNVGQDDSVTVLFPNKYVTDNHIAANADIVFPDDSQKAEGIRLRVFLPQTSRGGLDRIKVIATAKRIDLVKGKFPEGAFREYPGKDSSLITDLLKELAVLDESEWAEATVAYEVKEQ